MGLRGWGFMLLLAAAAAATIMLLVGFTGVAASPQPVAGPPSAEPTGFAETGPPPDAPSPDPATEAAIPRTAGMTITPAGPASAARCWPGVWASTPTTRPPTSWSATWVAPLL